MKKEKDVAFALIKRALKIGGLKKKYQTLENAKKFLNKCKKTNAKPFKINISFFSKLKQKQISKTSCYYYEGKSKKVVLYLHGGAFVVRPIKAHWIFIKSVCKKTDATVIMPIYPLAPQNDFIKTYESVLGVYKHCLKKWGSDNVTIMGDSAGATITLGMALLLKEKQLPMPKNFISISPCIDINFNNPKINKKEELDPMLSAIGCNYVCSSWSRGDNNNPLVSPLFGDFSNINGINIFAGTHEILYPDVKKFFNVLKNQKVKFKKTVGAKMIHCYPLFPIKKAVKARAKIYKIIKG